MFLQLGSRCLGSVDRALSGVVPGRETLFWQRCSSEGHNEWVIAHCDKTIIKFVGRLSGLGVLEEPFYHLRCGSERLLV